LKLNTLLLDIEGLKLNTLQRKKKMFQVH